jgi:hypothetical protein
MPLLRMTRDWLRGEEEHFDSPGSTLTDVAAELAKHDRHPFVRVRIAIAAPHIQSKGAHRHNHAHAQSDSAIMVQAN